MAVTPILAVHYQAGHFALKAVIVALLNSYRATSPIAHNTLPSKLLQLP